MDETDYKILDLLKQNSRATNANIASRVQLTEGAVRNRVRRLLQNRTIKRFTIETEVRIEAIVLIKTRTKGSREILRKIRQIADRLFETAGEFDVAVHLASENLQEINAKVDRLRRVDGVISTMTLMKIADDQTMRG